MSKKNTNEVSDDESISDDSLEVSETVTNMTNVTSDTILDSPEKEPISCALCVTRTKGNCMDRCSLMIMTPINETISSPVLLI